MDWRDDIVKNPFRICPFCESPTAQDDFLCEKCRKKVQSYNKLPKCPLCGKPMDTPGICKNCEEKTPSFDLAIACRGYHGSFKEALLSYKFKGDFFRAKGFAKLMAEAFLKLGVTADLMVSVPTTPIALFKRGYNSATELAFPLQKQLKIPFYPALFQKKWFAKEQVSLPKEERLNNVKGTFWISRRYQNKMKGKRILLVDDVITTGATANELSKLLKQNGAGAVYVVTLLGPGGEEGIP